MSKFNVLYSDNSMIAAHLRPFEKVIESDTDNGVTMSALGWIAALHGVNPNSLTLARNTADFTDVLRHGVKIGEITFIQES